MRSSIRIPISAALLGVSSFLGCYRETLRPLDTTLGPAGKPPYATLDARFCTSPPVISQQKVKYLFILDKSASNQFLFNPNPTDVSGTDPSGARRYGPMVQFINHLVPDPNVLTYFSLIDFNDQAFQLKDKSGALLNTFISDAQAFLSIVKTDWIGTGTQYAPSPKDSGYTNYVSALSMALSVISNDAKLESGNPNIPVVKSTYQIVFVSDGVPTINSGGGNTFTQTASEILPVIGSILALKDDPALKQYINEITLSTAYYFRNQQLLQAEVLLQQMANAGNGQYLHFGSGQGVTYQAFAPTVQTPKSVLADLFVENENAVWWDDGRFLLDSDKDGVPDEIEIKAGANPSAKDSDGNGVSDFVEYRIKGKPCANGSCDSSSRDNYSVCDGLSPVVGSNGFRTFPDTDDDGLNDCEEFLLKSNRYSFTSNGEFIPDLLAFKNGISFLPGTHNSQANVLGDGVSNYAKLKQGAPTSANPRGTLFLARETDLEPEESQEELNCYRLIVKNIALVGANNTLKVYLIQNSVAGENKPRLRVGVGTLSGESKNLKIEMGDGK